MGDYYNMNRGLNYIEKHYNNSDQNELGEYVTELIDMIEAKDDIIEKQRGIIKRDEKYLAHLPECFEDGCNCGLVELGEDRSKILKLTEK